MMRCLSALWLAGAVALSAAGCSRTTAGPPPGRAGTVILGETSEPISLNPLLLEGLSAGTVGSLLYSYLVTVDASGRLVPDAAAAVPSVRNGGISRDGLTITYHLRRGIRWHDGAPLTARDCVYTFRAIMDPHVLVPDRHGYDRIASVRAPDPYTVAVRLKRPFSPLVATFLEVNANYPIVPEHLFRRARDLNHLDPARYTVGSGPYRLVRWERGDRLVLDANPAYFLGKPRVARLILRFVPDADTIVNQLRTRELDGALNLEDPALIRPLSAIPGVTVTKAPAWGVAIVYFNAQRGATADPALRRALARAVDADAVVRRATQGAYGAARAWRGLFGAYDAAPELPRYDPVAARGALDALGWRTGANRVRTRNGVPLALTLVFSSAQPLYRIVATELQAELRAVGADVSIRGYPPTQFKAPAGDGGPMFGGRFDLILADIYTTGDADTSSYFTCSERAPAGFNISRLCDPVYDRIAERAERAADPAATRGDVARMETRLVRDGPAIVLAQLRFVGAFDDRLRGFAASPVTPYAAAWRWSLAAAAH